MQRETESYSDPKNQYLFKLVNMMDEAAWALTTEGTHARALRILAAVLSRISIDGDKKYSDIVELQRMAVYDYNKFITSSNVRMLFFQISTYLNQTYFKEFRSFRFQNPKGGSFGTE